MLCSGAIYSTVKIRPMSIPLFDQKIATLNCMSEENDPWKINRPHYFQLSLVAPTKYIEDG